MAVFAGILLVLSLIPILVLGRYSVMCIDDYDYGMQVHNTWITTGSFAGLWGGPDFLYRSHGET